MVLLRPASVVVLLLTLGSGAAWPQAVAPGSLPPPRPVQPAAPAAPAPAPPRPAAQAPQAAPRAPAATPAQARRPVAQPPAVGSRPPPPNRRPGAATAAGAAAGAAGAAGAAAAANRTPEPAAAPPPPARTTGQVSGLPLPRFASLRSDQVNMRVGPNSTYPIEWTFQRRDLPVQIVGEFQHWRRVRDVDGAEGWVHQSTLAGRRTVLVRPPAGTPEVTLRRRAETEAQPVARLLPGVIARIRECEAGNAWCEVQAAGHRGYLRRGEVWGIGAEEEIK